MLYSSGSQIIVIQLQFKSSKLKRTASIDLQVESGMPVSFSWLSDHFSTIFSCPGISVLPTTVTRSTGSTVLIGPSDLRRSAGKGKITRSALLGYVSMQNLGYLFSSYNFINCKCFELEVSLYIFANVSLNQVYRQWYVLGDGSKEMWPFRLTSRSQTGKVAPLRVGRAVWFGYSSVTIIPYLEQSRDSAIESNRPRKQPRANQGPERACASK